MSRSICSLIWPAGQEDGDPYALCGICRLQSRILLFDIPSAVRLNASSATMAWIWSLNVKHWRLRALGLPGVFVDCEGKQFEYEIFMRGRAGDTIP